MPSRTTPEVCLRRFTLDDVAAHNAGEDADTVRWLTEGHASTVASTTDWIRRGWAVHDGTATGELVFAVDLDGRLAGMVAVNPEAQDGVGVGDLNVSYAVHTWARRRGVATAAVRAVAGEVRGRWPGAALVIRVDPQNIASIAVADACGFVPAGSIDTAEGTLLVRRLALPVDSVEG